MKGMTGVLAGLALLGGVVLSGCQEWNPDICPKLDRLWEDEHWWDGDALDAFIDDGGDSPYRPVGERDFSLVLDVARADALVLLADAFGCEEHDA